MLVERKGVPERHIFTTKARLVIRGFQDTTKYDLTKTYSPVMRLMDFQFLIAIANKFQLKICQIDVKTTFLNGELENKIFMQIPQGVEGREKLDSSFF